jgi:7-cyano-7-deazaguanine reductase
MTAHKKTARTPPAAGSLTWLGRKTRGFPAAPDRACLETFANQYPRRDYTIHLVCPEFTALCPLTGQPDFGVITIDYVPERRCLESKSLKLYLFSYRNWGTFYESAVNRILDDLVQACRPRKATVSGTFTPRGGIAITVTAAYPPPR